MISEYNAIRHLLNLTRKLLKQTSLHDALQVVTDTALALIPAEHVSIRVLDDTGVYLLSGARSGQGASHEPMDFRKGEGLIGWVVQHGKVVRLDDTLLDDRFVTHTEQGFSIRSILTVPLRSADKVVGVLGLTSSEPGAFSSDDEVMGALLANCAVPAIEKARLERLAVTDLHTMAFNQRYLFPRLLEEMSRSTRYQTPLSVLMMDLDHFKRVNDLYGHMVGDMVLQSFANRVRKNVRLPDIFIRRGGEEFMLLMPNTDGQQAIVVAERIRRSLVEQPLDAGFDLRIHQTVSIGVACWDGEETPENLEIRADGAMYEAKKRGRGKVVSIEGDVFCEAGKED